MKTRAGDESNHIKAYDQQDGILSRGGGGQAIKSSQDINLLLVDCRQKLRELDEELEKNMKSKSTKVPLLNTQKALSQVQGFLSLVPFLTAEGLESIISKTWKVAQELTENVLVLQTNQVIIFACGGLNRTLRATLANVCIYCNPSRTVKDLPIN